MREFGGMLGARGIHVIRFEFGYITARRLGTGGGGQPRAEAVIDEYRRVVEQVGGLLVIGGKSFGGRVASMLAGELHANGRRTGLVRLGYPFSISGQARPGTHRAPGAPGDPGAHLPRHS